MTSTSFTTERIFSLSCIEGLRLLRKHQIRHPDILLTQLIPIVEKVEADAQSLDLEASVYLSSLVEHKIEIDDYNFYRTCIRAILLRHQPAWLKSMKSGRKRFAAELSSDDYVIFEAAGLMEDVPSAELVEWWDDISGRAHLATGLENMKQGREAERLSLESERKRLKDEGISREPEWLGLDDNYAGYDILTYDQGETGLVNRQIEVKSTIASPPRFFISRNEWQKAEKSGEAYCFHVWNMQRQPPELHIFSVLDVAPHIPTDNGKGRWSNTEVRVK